MCNTIYIIHFKMQRWQRWQNAKQRQRFFSITQALFGLRISYNCFLICSVHYRRMHCSLFELCASAPGLRICNINLLSPHLQCIGCNGPKSRSLGTPYFGLRPSTPAPLGISLNKRHLIEIATTISIV